MIDWTLESYVREFILFELGSVVCGCCVTMTSLAAGPGRCSEVTGVDAAGQTPSSLRPPPIPRRAKVTPPRVFLLRCPPLVASDSGDYGGDFRPGRQSKLSRLQINLVYETYWSFLMENQSGN